MIKDRNRAAGEEDHNLHPRPTMDAYPAGVPLRAEEIKVSRDLRPRSAETGDCHFWDFTPHGGGKIADGIRRMGKHEVIKLQCLPPLFERT